MSDSFDALRPFLEKRRRYHHLMSVVSYDLETVTPPKALAAQDDMLNYFSGECAKIYKDPQFIDAVKAAHKDDSLNDRQKHLVDSLFEEIAFFEKIDIETYNRYMATISKSMEVWRQAKTNDDFALFLPHWEAAIQVAKEMAEIRRANPSQTPYDIVLNEYEKGMDTVGLEKVFVPLRDFLSSALPDVLAKQGSAPMPKIPFCKADNQRRFGEEILRQIGFDFDTGAMRESMHPFTDHLHQGDVRVTTRILEEDFRSSLFSVIHEGGHAIEFQNLGQPQYDDFTEGMASASVCETHSRFYENILGRSREFAKTLQKACQKHFGAPFYFMDHDSFYRLINWVERSLIRTESDEFTYCLHIIIRYEIERDLMNGTLQAKDAPSVWKQKYKELLGVDVPNDREGILQDVHWSGVSFGYFPTYALGNMFGAMIRNKMKEDIPFGKILSSGNLIPFRDWFTEHDFPYNYMPSKEWILKVTGREFDSSDFIDYLKEKYL